MTVYFSYMAPALCVSLLDEADDLLGAVWAFHADRHYFHSECRVEVVDADGMRVALGQQERLAISVLAWDTSSTWQET